MKNDYQKKAGFFEDFTIFREKYRKYVINPNTKKIYSSIFIDFVDVFTVTSTKLYGL